VAASTVAEETKEEGSCGVKKLTVFTSYSFVYAGTNGSVGLTCGV